MDKDRFERLRDRLISEGAPSLFPRPLAKDPLYSRMRPLAEAMYLVIATDDVLTDQERNAIRGALRLLSQGSLGGSALDAMLDEFQRGRSQEGVELRLDAIAAELFGDREDSELAVSLALAAAKADARVDADECHIVFGLAERLGVSKQRLGELQHG